MAPPRSAAPTGDDRFGITFRRPLTPSPSSTKPNITRSAVSRWLARDAGAATASASVWRSAWVFMASFFELLVMTTSDVGPNRQDEEKIPGLEGGHTDLHWWAPSTRC